MTAITIGCAVAEGGGEKCQWSYKCDIVLENDPFVCGKWRNTPDIVCTDSSDSVVDLTTVSCFSLQLKFRKIYISLFNFNYYTMKLFCYYYMHIIIATIT